MRKLEVCVCCYCEVDPLMSPVLHETPASGLLRERIWQICEQKGPRDGAVGTLCWVQKRPPRQPHCLNRTTFSE